MDPVTLTDFFVATLLDAAGRFLLMEFLLFGISAAVLLFKKI